MGAEASLGAISELCQPIFKSLLMRRFNGAKSNSHSRGPRIGHVTESHECRPAAINPDADLCSPGKGSGRFDKAAKNAQITRDGRNLPF